jgi:hypothetical protein
LKENHEIDVISRRSGFELIFKSQSRLSKLDDMGQQSSISPQRSGSLSDIGYHQVTSGVRVSPSFSDPKLKAASCSARWSRYLPEALENPCPRTGHFYAYSKERNIIAVGCGANCKTVPLADFWVLDLRRLAWRQVTPLGDQLSPRTGARAVIADDKLYIFGGVADPVFYNDVFVIDLESRVCQKLETTGDVPSPRNTPVFCHHNGQLIVWGGYDGHWPSDLHVLDLRTLVWSVYKQSIPGKTGTTYAVIGDRLYCYASQFVGGIVVIDLTAKTVSQVQTSGIEPPEGVVSSGMVAIEDRLLLVGGKTEGDFSLVYACDIRQMIWYIFDILPDCRSVTVADGQMSPNGSFMIPRLASMGIIYDERKRRVVSFLGRPMDDPTPIHLIHVENANAVIHLQQDLIDALKQY